MSVHISTYVICDGPEDGTGCSLDASIPATYGEEAAYDRAERAGWDIDGDTDMCPTCRRAHPAPTAPEATK